VTQGFTNPFQIYTPGLTFYSPTFPNPKFINGFVGNAGSGDIDLYTVPTGRRAMAFGISQFHSGADTTGFSQVKIGGSYYRLGSNLTLTTTASQMQSSPGFFNGYIAEAGETLAVNLTAAGLNIWFRIIEFDNTSPLRTVKKIASWSAGDNTIYTVTAGKTGLIFITPSTATATVQGSITVGNSSGSTRTYNGYLVPNGGSSGATNQFLNATTLTNNNGSPYSLPACLNSGDFVVLNTDAATDTQVAFVTIYEV